MICSLDTLMSSLKYVWSGMESSQVLLVGFMVLRPPILIWLTLIPYGGSTIARSKNLSGNCFIKSMQSQHLTSEIGISSPQKVTVAVKVAAAIQYRQCLRSPATAYLTAERMSSTIKSD